MVRVSGVTRRSVVLRAASGIAAGGIGGAALAATATPALADHENAVPSHTTIRFDRTRLERYLPLIYVPSSAEVRPSRWYGWIVESPEYRYDVFVYYLYYPLQKGVTGADSHDADREPVYVFVDPDLREVRETVYSAYHWMSYRWLSPQTHVPEDESSEHVMLAMVPPWHHYRKTANKGEFFDLEPLGRDGEGAFSLDGESETKYGQWLSNGWEEALQPGVVTDPERMRWRESWWRDGYERGDRWWWRTQLQLAALGFQSPRLVGGAGQSDLS